MGKKPESITFELQDLFTNQKIFCRHKIRVMKIPICQDTNRDFISIFNFYNCFYNRILLAITSAIIVSPAAFGCTPSGSSSLLSFKGV